MKLTKEPTINIDKIIEQTAKKILDEHLTNLLRLGYLLQVNTTYENLFDWIKTHEKTGLLSEPRRGHFTIW